MRKTLSDGLQNLHSKLDDKREDVSLMFARRLSHDKRRLDCVLDSFN
jgi:hypothetical protein